MKVVNREENCSDGKKHVSFMLCSRVSEIDPPQGRRALMVAVFVLISEGKKSKVQQPDMNGTRIGKSSESLGLRSFVRRY